jgi:predicted site-specific integrase-resolvase
MVATIDGLSKSQAANILGLSGNRIDQLLNAGKLPYIQTALGRLVDEAAVHEMKRQRERAKEEKAMTTTNS